MGKLNVNSEIGRLKTVLLHRPGEELNNLTPRFLGELLFDDIPWLPLAQKEHDAFAEVFRKAGVKVVYLLDLVSEALEDNKIREQFIHQFIEEANIYSQTLKEVVYDYLISFKDVKEMVAKTMTGIKKSELKGYEKRTLFDYADDNPFVTNPIPNLYFTRDPFAIIGDGVSLNKMYSMTRNRETIYGEYIFKYRPEYKNTRLFYQRDNKVNIEGGDILVLNKKTLIVGISQRTHPSAIELLAKNLFYNNKTEYTTVLAFQLPNQRTFMHLDTIFTQVDYGKFMVHEACYKDLTVYRISRHPKLTGKLQVEVLDASLGDILEEYVGRKVTIIPCGGEDSVSADREQWSDGSNAIAIAPGKVITYQRNDITNRILEANGIEVYKIPSSELSRGRGGPRCMCMPLEREEIED